MSGDRPLLHDTRHRNHSGDVAIWVPIGCIASLLSVILRIYVSLRKQKQLGADDNLLLLCFVIVIAQSAMLCMGIRATHGLPFQDLPPKSLNLVFVYGYAASILANSSMALAKASVVELYRRINVYQSSRRISIILHLMIILWFLFTLFAITFRCKLPAPWFYTSDRCMASWPIFVSVVTTNIFTDLVIVLHVIPGLWRLQTSRKLRIGLIILFGSRLLVCIPSFVRIAIVGSPTFSHVDGTGMYTRLSILQNVELHVSIITANFPRIQSLFTSFRSDRSAGRNLPSASQSGTPSRRDTFVSTHTYDTANTIFTGKSLPQSFPAASFPQFGGPMMLGKAKFTGAKPVPSRTILLVYHMLIILNADFAPVPQLPTELHTSISSNNRLRSHSSAWSITSCMDRRMERFNNRNYTRPPSLEDARNLTSTPRRSEATMRNFSSDIIVDLEITRRESFHGTNGAEEVPDVPDRWILKQYGPTDHDFA
ncbi:hypothetical protein BT63DRAFT_453444 [Microthyrium microscopicum]|uniref:Rhodopsin domain-containing protein n=1 Tax=Microthyrium microscopicum TaxID=703497 RepID=A0A6A6UI04_9PEZI|nr:hypothetical protein BT63DRAFT_453444 [Microthyrium microscopicum]